MSPHTIVLVFSVVFGAAFTSACPRECPAYWTSYGDYCYRLFGSPHTWHHAEGNCRRSYPGRTPHLVSVHSYGEKTFIKQLMETASGADKDFHYWIGLNELHWPGNYEWSDYSRYNYADWQSSEPNSNNERCVEIRKDSTHYAGWNDKVCSYKRSYICKMPK